MFSRNHVKPVPSAVLSLSKFHACGFFDDIAPLLPDAFTPAMAQCQFHAVAQAAKIHCKQAVAIHTHRGAPNQFLLGKSVVHGASVQISQGVATVQSTQSSGLACNVLIQQPVVNLRNQIKPVLSQVQRTFEEVVVPEILDGIKTVLAQTQQCDVGLEMLANQRPSGVRAEVVREIFDDQVGHDRIHLLGEQNFIPKSLIYFDKSTSLAMTSRIHDLRSSKVAPNAAFFLSRHYQHSEATPPNI